MAKITKAEQIREAGQILKCYGSKTFFAVTPVPFIDKIKFSIVEMGTSGKDFIDIYLNTEEVRQFIADIDSGVAKQKIAADQGSFPSAYKWVRGDKGKKSLVIGGGSKGIRVQATDATGENKRMKMTVIQYADLSELSFMFKLVYGLIPVVPGSYYDTLYQALVENLSKGRNNFSNYKDDDDEAATGMDGSDAMNDDPQEDAVVITTISRGQMQEAAGGLKVVPVTIKETGEATSLVFTEEQAKAISWFAKYQQKLATLASGVEMTVKAVRRSKYYYYVAAVNKK